MSKKSGNNTSIEDAYNSPLNSRKVTGKNKKTESNNQWTSTLKNNNSK